MKKIYTLLFAMLLAFGVLAGCGTSDNNETSSDSNKTETAAFPVTIKDAADEKVVIDSKPESIVSLIPSNTEIAFALGLGDEVVGVTDYDNYPEEATKKESVGGLDFNVEKVLALAPDLVLAHASNAHNAKDALQQLRDAGINVLVVNDAENFAQVYDSINMIGKATGTTAEAKEIVTDMKVKVANIKEKASAIKDKKTVYLEVSPAPDIYAAGKNTFMDEMLNIINAKNVVTEEGWPQIDQEAIIQSNPDVIITTYGYYTEGVVDQIVSREGWQDVTAVKNKAVVDINSDAVTRSGPRLVEGVEDLAKAIYPDVFK